MNLNHHFSAGLLGLILPLAVSAEPVWVGRFSEADSAIPAPWKIERLNEKHPPRATPCGAGMAWLPLKRTPTKAWPCWHARLRST